MIRGRFIDIEGFGSIVKRTVYKLHNRGLYILYGENGAGKSTIPNALVWCIYGQTLKRNARIEPWEQTQGKEYEETKVRFFFSLKDKNILIVRTLKKLSVFVDGHPIKPKKKTDIQKWIIEKIGYSFELFKSSVIFGQKLRRLMSEDSQTKKKILEETFETSFINRARDEVSNKLTKTIHELKIKDTEFQGLEEKLWLTKEQYQYANKVVNEEQAERDAKKLKITEQLQVLHNDFDNNKLIDEYHQKHIFKYKRLLKKYERKYNKDLESHIFRAEMGEKNIQARIEVAEKDLQSQQMQKQNVPRNCDKCGHRMNKDEVLKYISTIIKAQHETKLQLDKDNKALAEMQDELKSLRVRNVHNEKFKLKFFTYTNKVAHFRRLRRDNKNERKLLKQKYEMLNNELTELNKPIKTNQEDNKKKLKKLVKEFTLAVYKEEKVIKSFKKKRDTYQWMLNDPLSNQGLKVFIFNTMLRNVNNELKKYFNYIGYQIILSMDLESTYKNLNILVKHGKYETEYESLSGGQQQLIDVALMFGLNDALTKTKPISFLFLDEVFESLTKTNIEKVEQIIADRAEKKSIHLITHTQSFPGYPKIEVTLNSKGQTELTI